MKRNSFCGGEISPGMALRSDMDVYQRSCSRLVNFDVSQTGGITRRRGMASVAPAMDESILLPYKYDEESVYLVELGHHKLIVYSTVDGSAVREFESSSYDYRDLKSVQAVQCNALLIITSPDMPPMQLRMNAADDWTFGVYDFKMPPWYSEDVRDGEAVVTNEGASLYSVAFGDGVPSDEAAAPTAGEMLRVSYYTTQAEAFAKSSALRAGVRIETLVTAASSFAVGDKIAIRTDTSCQYFVCTAAFTGSNSFVEGLASPKNYPDNFLEAEDCAGFDEVEPIYAMTASMNFTKGQKVALQSGYYSLYTCIKAFSSGDFLAGFTSPDDYPDYFINGIAVGNALPCGGDWEFYCSGSWFGSYEVRRCYDSSALEGNWETMGESFSRIGSSTNELITGTEKEEECWLRLFITRSRYMGLNNLESGWPADSCSNRLIVYSYKHDMQLKARSASRYVDVSPVNLPVHGKRTSTLWSWGAFSARYGYPRVAVLHESRLLFAATDSQPQTIWSSRTDDLNNFRVGNEDNGGMLLTMNTSTQAAICWMASRGDVLMIGTEDGEWIVQAPNNGALTPETVRIINYGHHGSAHTPPLMTSERVLYFERGSGRVYEYGFNYDSASYISTDVTIFADHIAREHGGFRSGTILRKPDARAAVAMGDGTLALMTYNAFHNVNAWHLYTTEGSIESVAATSDGQEQDKLFLIVSRPKIGRWIECISASSGYTDADGKDYESVMETCYFSVPETNDKRVHVAPAEFFITTPACPVDSVRVRSSTDEWALPSLPAFVFGWNKLISWGGYSSCPKFGIRVTGSQPFGVLAFQV